MSNIAEELVAIAENVPKVYEAGRKAEMKNAYAENILPSDERFVYSETENYGSAWYDGNVLNISGDGTITVNVTGYVELSLTISGGACNIYADGNIVYKYSTDDVNFPEQIFEFTGQVNESIYITGAMLAITINRFWLIKQEDSLQNILDTAKADGMQEFWNAYQDNGKRYNYNQAFFGQGWGDKNYNPIYPFGQVRYAGSMFSQNGITDTKRPLDLTNCTSSPGSVFQSSTKLKTVRTITVHEGITFKNWFDMCLAIEELEFAGTIGQSGLDLHWSTNLTAASLLSVLTALSKDASIATGKSVTFATASQAVIKADDECTEQYNLAIEAGWTIAFNS